MANRATTIEQQKQKLRSVLLKYTSQIELAFRTAVIYHLSTKYDMKPCWYLDKTIVKEEVIAEIISGYANLRKNGAIKNHHVNHRRSKFAPAWKTLYTEPNKSFYNAEYQYNWTYTKNNKQQISNILGHLWAV